MANRLTQAGRPYLFHAGFAQQHHHLERNRVVERAQVKAGYALYLVQAGHQRDSMYLQLASGFA